MASDDAESRDFLTADEPGGFTQVPDSLLLNTEVSDGAYRLYALLKHYARKKGNAFPGRRRLARELGVKSMRTVDARIAELKAFGYLEVTARFLDLGGQTSNSYHLRFYPVQETAQGPVQNAAPPEGSALHGPGAAECEPPVQPVARQRSTSTRSTSTPTQTRRTRKPAVARAETSRSDDAVGSTASSSGQAVPGVAPSAGNLRRRDGGGVDEAYVEELLNRLPSPLWPRSASQRSALESLLAPLVATWPAAELATALTEGRPLPEVVSHPIGLLRSRIDQLPAKKATRKQPAWCGLCEEHTRLLDDEVAGTVERCPHCHPARVAQTKESA